MIILFKHIMRNIRANKFRSLLIIISLAISTMVMFMNLTIKDDIAKKYTTVLRGAYQDYDLAFYKDDADGETNFKQSDIDLSSINTENVLYSMSAYGVYIKDDENLTVSIMGIDKEMVQKTNLCTLDKKSKDFDPEAEDQIIVSKKTAERFDWKLDQEITIYTQDGEHTVKITGIAKNSGIYLAEFSNILMISPVSFAAKCAEAEGSISEVVIDLPDGADANEAAKTLEKANEGYSAYSIVDEDSIKEALEMINKLLMIILFLVIGLNFYIIASITKLILATRIPVIGTFRSLGATKGKTNFILIFENVVFGVIGALIGIGLGIAVRDPISGIFINAGDAFDYVNIKLDFKISYVIISICFSVGLQILITLSSILKTGRRSIKDNIFNTLSTMARVSKKKTIIGCVLLLLSVVIFFVNRRYNFVLSISAMMSAICGAVLILPLLTKYFAAALAKIFGKVFGGPAELGLRNISSSKTIRSSITLITVGLALILMVYGAAFSLKDLFQGFREMADYDLQLSGMSETEDEYQSLKDLDGVEDLAFYYYSFADFKMNGKATDLDVIGTDKFFSGIKGDKKLLSNLEDDEVLVDEFFAMQHKLEKGDTITLASSDMKSDKKKYKIMGYIDASNFTTRRNVIMMNQTEYKNEFGNIPSEIDVYANKDPKEVKETLIKELAGTGITVQTLDEFLDMQEDSNQSLFNMIEVIMALSIVLAVFGLINNQLIGFVQRKREYAVLYSVSMSRSQLRKMLFFEAFGTFITGCTFAVALSFWLIHLLYTLLMSIGMGYRLSLDPVALVKIIVIVLFVLSFTTISPIRKITKLNIVNEIKYE